MRAKLAPIVTIFAPALTLISLLAWSAQVPPAPPPPVAAGTEAPPAPPGSGAGSEVTLELKRNQRPLIRLAFPAFHGTATLAPAEAATAGREIEATVRQDLIFSGYFQIQGPGDFAALHVTGDPQRDLEAYRSAGNDVLLAGEVRTEEERIVFEGRLFDLKSGQSILAKRYRGGASVARRVGHTFADEVIRYLTGGKGIGLSSIAFTSDRTGFKEIFLMDYDGLNQRRITGHRSTSMSPAWTPSGDALAYTSFVNGPPGLYVAELSSGRKHPLVTSGSLNISPSFSPDGARVAFARSVEGNVEIFTAGKDGADLRRLTHNDAIDTNPAWSPKGGVIAFTSSRGGSPHIYLMDAEGTNVRRLTFEGEYNDGAAWSPEGDLLAYASRRSGRFQVAVTNIATQETRVLTSGPGENQSPTFSPDGRKIAFTSRRTGTHQIFVMDLDGGNVHQLTSEGNNDMADWSRGQP
ncbi:MAG TPA: Tol-Pal system beta propeller repeat protein TolB [Thermoanaerobaculia bacterium]|nr:Tol-Pal system beta propeller repeat protein TolB [Thermoanaerobaculia bacterium]